MTTTMKLVALLGLLVVAQAASLRGAAVRSLKEKEDDMKEMDGMKEEKMEMDDGMKEEKMAGEEKPMDEDRVLCNTPVKYQVLADCTWTAQTHPTDYPKGFAHWSPFCGTTHSDEASLYSLNGTATPGIQLVAETGGCSRLQEEVEECAAKNSCSDFLKYPCNPFSGKCMSSGTFDVTDQYPYFSIVSMIAPSPDWFVGVDSFKLCKDNGYWWSKYDRYLMALDAGTDSGASFKSANAPTTPRARIIPFDAEDSSNIFYNQVENELKPLCKITLTLVA